METKNITTLEQLAEYMNTLMDIDLLALDFNKVNEVIDRNGWERHPIWGVICRDKDGRKLVFNEAIEVEVVAV